MNKNKIPTHMEARGNMKDRCLFADLSKTGQTAFAALDGIQYAPPEQQVLGSALVFLCFCKRYNLDPAEMLLIAGHMFREGLTNQNVQIYAMKHFMKFDIADPYAFTF